MKKFKVLIATVGKGGTIDRQRSLATSAAKDLEGQINAIPGAIVSTVSAYDSDHDFQLIAVVEYIEEVAPADLAAQGE